MHIHYLTSLKGVYSQPCHYSSCVNQPPFYSFDFYSSTIVKSISPYSLLTVSIHVLFSHPSTQGKNITYIICTGIPDLFLKWTMKLFTKGVCMVYNNLLWMWITLFCQKPFSLWNCSVHTWQAGKELLFQYNITSDLENIEVCSSDVSLQPEVMIEQSFRQAFHITLAQIKTLLLFLSCTKSLLLHILAPGYLEEFFIFNVSIVSSPLSII